MNYPELYEGLTKFRELFIKGYLSPRIIAKDQSFLKRVAERNNWSQSEALQIYRIIKPHSGLLNKIGFKISSIPPIVDRITTQNNRVMQYKVRYEKLIGYDKESFVVYFPYDKNIYNAVNLIPGSKWNPEKRYWNVPLAKVKELNEFGKKYKFKYTEKGRAMLSSMVENYAASYNAEKVDIDLPMKLEPYPFQYAGIDYGMKNKCVIYGDEMGLGKAQPLDSKILTPDGWKIMKDINIGDYVIGSVGWNKVVGIYPQGNRPVYEVIFTDESKTECDENHIWSVNTTSRKYRGNPNLLMTLKEIIDSGLKYKNGNNKYFIPVVNTVSFTGKKFKIYPYLMGILLGDGGITDRPTITTSDLQIIKDVKFLLRFFGMKVKHKYKYDYRLTYKKGVQNPLKLELVKLGLWGKKSENKFIPKNYLYTSISDRISLLQGLIDSDGYISKDGTIQFCTVSDKLSDDFIELIRGLGGIAKHSIKKVYYKGKRYKDCNIITINLPYNIIPCRLERKLKNIKTKKKYNPSRAIKEINYIGKKECKCIRIERDENSQYLPNDHLYVTDDYILTHNTPQAIGVTLGLNSFPALVICPKSLRFNWLNEWHKFSHKKAFILNKDNIKYLPQFFELGIYDVAIINFEGARTLFTKEIHEIEITKGKRKGKTNKRIILHGYEKLFKTSILDEAHEVNNEKTLRFKTIKPVMAASEIKMVLTGSPIVKKTNDLASLIDLIGRIEEFGGRYNFVRKYNKFKKESLNSKVLPANLRELNIKLRSLCFIRREKSQVLKDLPEKTIQIVPIEIDNKKEYDEAFNAFRFWLQNQNYDEEKISKAMKAEVLVKIGVLKRLSSRGKFYAFEEKVNEIIESGEKVVVFCWHKETANYINEQFENVLLITGDVTDEQVEDNKKKFQEDPKYQIIVCTFKRGGVGHNLTAASKVIIHEPGWTYKDHSQAIDRVHRIGLKFSILALCFVGINTIDEDIYDVIDQRREMEKQATGGKTELNINIAQRIVNKALKSNEDGKS